MSLIVSYAYLIPILQESKVNALYKVAQVRGTRGKESWRHSRYCNWSYDQMLVFLLWRKLSGSAMRESGLNLLFLAILVHISQGRCTPCIVLLRPRFTEIFRVWTSSFSFCDLVVAVEYTGSYLFTYSSYVIRNTVQALLNAVKLHYFDKINLIVEFFWQQCPKLCLGRWRPHKTSNNAVI